MVGLNLKKEKGGPMGGQISNLVAYVASLSPADFKTWEASASPEEYNAVMFQLNHRQGNGFGVERTGTNPFYADVPEDKLANLCEQNQVDATVEINVMRGELATLFDKVQRENPEAVMNISLPELPKAPKSLHTHNKKGVTKDLSKEKLELEQYMKMVREAWFEPAKAKLEGLMEQSITDRIDVYGQAILDVSTQNLAATLGIGGAILNELQEIKNVLENDTHLILEAIDKNGQKILGRINKLDGKFEKIRISHENKIIINMPGVEGKKPEIGIDPGFGKNPWFKDQPPFHQWDIGDGIKRDKGKGWKYEPLDDIKKLPVLPGIGMNPAMINHNK